MDEIIIPSHQVVMNENNSGGYWWLNADQVRALWQAGWTIYAREGWGGGAYISKRFHTESSADAIMLAESEFTRITGYRADEPGCSCCGQPFWFDVDESPYWMSEDLSDTFVRMPDYTGQEVANVQE